MLHRPYLRKSVREEIQANAPKNSEGKFIDPNTHQVIEGPFHYGHVTSHEFRREKAIAENEGLSQADFNDKMNNPDLYQIEDPTSNMQHTYEDHSPVSVENENIGEDSFGEYEALNNESDCETCAEEDGISMW